MAWRITRYPAEDLLSTAHELVKRANLILKRAEHLKIIDSADKTFFQLILDTGSCDIAK